MWRTLLALTATGALPISFAQSAATRAVSPQEALTKFQIEPGLKIELVAAEPLVQSPAAIAWDEANRLFVAENTGYPTGPQQGEKPLGKIVELRDRDADGKADERIEFATGLHFPNGLMPWHGGWLVTDAPHLYWLCDTNQDGSADVKEIWFTGFATNQSTQLRACYPLLGPDGWIYVARGWSAGVITSPKWTNLPAVDLKNGDFRFRPDGSKAEAIGGNAQFGMLLDDVGRRFLTSNRNPIMHAVAWPHWWKRMPNFYFTEITQDVSPVGADAKVFPISADLTTSGFMPELMSAPHAGTFTSACGLHQFFGEALPSEFQGSWFVCEPAQNLVQRQIMEQEGATFRTRRATEGKEFLASTDTWFHPVYVGAGPDGALYIADMYRNFIDHPEYLPKETREKIDFDAGRERGRIWKIYGTKAEKTVALTNTTPQVLASALTSSNIWKRQTAHRLILEKPADAVVLELSQLFSHLKADKTANNDEELLEKLARAREEKDPPTGPHLGRARAVLLLHDLLLNHRKTLRPETANQALHAVLMSSLDSSPSVREAAFRVFQVTSDKRNPIPDVSAGTLALWANDPNPAARFHLAYSLGQGDYQRMTEALVAIVRRDAGDRWTRAVVLSGLAGRMHEFAEKWFAPEWGELPGTPHEPIGFVDKEAFVALAYEMGRVYGAHGGSDRTLLQEALREPAAGAAWQAALFTGFLQAGHRELRARSTHPRDAEFSAILAKNRVNALNGELPLYQRIAAVRFLGEVPESGSEALLHLVLRPNAKELQITAARALVKAAGTLPPKIFEEWRGLGADIREIFVQYLVSKPEQSWVLLDAIERAEVPVWNINSNRRRTLLNSSDAKVKERAERLLGSGAMGDRRRAFEEIKTVLTISGDAEKGRAVFVNLCASCHQYKAEGHKVGPDLTGVKNQPAEALLYHIVVPDAEIYPGFQNYEVETVDGEHLNGLLVDENDAAITLLRALGEKHQVERNKIARLRASASSLMPAELERAMSRQELADLLAFLKSGF